MAQKNIQIPSWLAVTFALLMLLGFALGVIGFYLGITSSQGKPVKIFPAPNDGVACTMEAKLCPDGSYVGRTGAKCEFAPCPGFTTPQGN